MFDNTYSGFGGWGQVIGTAISTVGQVVVGTQTLKQQRENQRQQLLQLTGQDSQTKLILLAIMAFVIILLIFLISKKK